MQIPIIPLRGQRRPWTSIPRINRLHPLAQGLLFYAYDLGGVVIDLANGGNGKLLSQTTHSPVTTSPFGSGFKYPGVATSDCVTLPLVGTKVSTFSNTAPFSAACGCFGSVPATTNAYIASTGTSTTDIAGFASNGTAAKPLFFFNNGGSQVTFATGSFVANVYHTLIAVATSGTTATLYLDGKLDSSVTAITTTNATTGQQININAGAGNGSFGGGLNGFAYYFAGWNRILTISEARLLHNDPYCFLIYPEDEMFATLVGAGFNPATAWFLSPWSTIGKKINIIGDR